MEEDIQVGYQVFTSDGGEEVGAVRGVLRDRRRLVVYIENTGDCEIPFDAIAAVHSQKVILNFNGILWPHVSVGTLVPDALIPVSPSQWA